ncbi:hypothetical protein QVD17_32218 [Tagetes erecta]|uniref:Uncharacterized protein n=1 Tax=Tagetes erecta TaxID=13708 RepID=A0AAD8K986_TARER|nr:hypothetical protein QVD17_32218 [Tagetes erecta]
MLYHGHKVSSISTIHLPDSNQFILQFHLCKLHCRRRIVRSWIVGVGLGRRNHPISRVLTRQLLERRR